MRVVINHLTRMQPGYICVAGIDVRTNQHVRPVLRRARLTTDLLARNGGAFDIGRVVDLEPAEPNGSGPETEDHIFDLGRLVAVEELDSDSFWELLNGIALETLTEIFGEALHAQRRGCAVDEDEGDASLGCLRTALPPSIEINRRGKIRARVADGTFDVDLSVTDLRLYEEDMQTPRAAMVANIQQRIQQGVGVILSVGLARAFQVSGDTRRRHWLQVNNFYLEDDPIWTDEQ
jgi:hypothetical protein